MCVCPQLSPPSATLSLAAQIYPHFLSLSLSLLHAKVMLTLDALLPWCRSTGFNWTKRGWCEPKLRFLFSLLFGGGTCCRHPIQNVCICLQNRLKRDFNISVYNQDEPKAQLSWSGWGHMSSPCCQCTGELSCLHCSALFFRRMTFCHPPNVATSSPLTRPLVWLGLSR